MMKFEELDLKPEIIKALEHKGYKIPTPIQAQAIPAILKGRDILGGAQTGTGKTAAFALPIIQRLSDRENHSPAPRALVITPTRELAGQVADSFKTYGKFFKLNTCVIYGGVNIKTQISNLRNGTDIIVATPGRLLDHLQQRTIKLNKIETLVLDEADRMLDMGFIRDIEKIISFLPKQRQNLLFSATYSKEIKKLSTGILTNPLSVEVTRQNSAAEKIEQKVHLIEKQQKRHLLAHLIKQENWYQVLIFVKTKHGANRLTGQLLKQGIPSAAIHGNKSQAARNRALASFKKGDLQALVATDIAARGIDLQDLSHVVNFDLPHVAEDYIHRIGRTGRAGKSGIAISLISPEDNKLLQNIQRLLKFKIAVQKVEGFTPVKIAPSQPRAQVTNHSNPKHRPNQTPKGNKSFANKKGKSNKKKTNGMDASRPRSY